MSVKLNLTNSSGGNVTRWRKWQQFSAQLMAFYILSIIFHNKILAAWFSYSKLFPERALHIPTHDAPPGYWFVLQFVMEYLTALKQAVCLRPRRTLVWSNAVLRQEKTNFTPKTWTRNLGRVKTEVQWPFLSEGVSPFFHILFFFLFLFIYLFLLLVAGGGGYKKKPFEIYK